MAINKVVYGNNTLIDLTNDTITSDTLLEGVTAHKADGTNIVGTVIVQNYYKGSEEPTPSIGSDGDLYFITE